MLCQYCNREAKTLVSNAQHELYCKNNPNKREKIPSYGMLGKTKESGFDVKNQWSKSEYTMSEESRKKISEISKKQVWTDERRKIHSERMREVAKNNPESYSSSNRGRTKQIIFDGLKFQGNWELDFYKWCLSKNIRCLRNNEGFKYQWNGERTYYPDFYLPEQNLYVEVKGYKTERDSAKWEQFPKRLIIVQKQDMINIKNDVYSSLVTGSSPVGDTNIIIGEYMNDGGKGSKPRPYNISQEEYSARWDLVFNKRIQKEADKFEKGVLKNEYYDILSTEDCLIRDETDK